MKPKSHSSRLSVRTVKQPIAFRFKAYWIRLCLLGFAMASLSLAERRLRAESPLRVERPNVLMIILDDLNDWVGCLEGHPHAHTPNIDRLAEEGMLFSNAHCAAPVCNASRVATLTGRRPGSTGIYDNRVRWHEALPEVVTIPSYFKSQGYHVAGGGKVYHHMPGFNRPSDWHEYFDQQFDGHYQAGLHGGLDVTNFRYPSGFPLNGLANVKAMQRPPRNPREFDWGPLSKLDAKTGDGKLTEWAVNFLKRKQERPFFLSVGIYRPHLPFYAPQKYFDLHPLESATLPALKQDDLLDLPKVGLDFAAQRREDFELVVRSGKHAELVRAYLASVSFADAMVGRLLDVLKKTGQQENTLVVLWSDHGWHFGEKQHLHKFTLWERATRIPFILSVPGMPRRGEICEQPVGMLSLFPTLGELCHLPPVEGLDGQSFANLIKNPMGKRERPALISHGKGNHALRTDRWRYIRYADGGEELYDHRTDPNEWHNVAGQPEFLKIKEDLAWWFPVDDVNPRKKKR